MRNTSSPVQMAASRASATEILTSSILISQRLQAALASPLLLILHRSQWRCQANSYSAVLQALLDLLDRACSFLGVPLQQESMCHKLIQPLHALHEAVRDGETCVQECQLPSSPNATHSWLLDSVLKRGMSTEIMDRHLHHLLWTSSVVCEQILRYAPIDDTGFVPAEQITRDLCEIWQHVDASDDILEAQSMLNRIVAEEEGETSLLANFILQKLVSAKHMNHMTDSADLPTFLWVDPQDLRRNPEILGEGAHSKIQEAIWLGGHFAVQDIFHVENNVQLEREVTIQAQLHHPNVIPLVCCSRNPLMQKFSVVMELMRQDLQLLILQNMQRAKMETPFRLVHAIDLMLQIAQGMEYLHGDDLRIIHRDLKSFNILVCFSSNADHASSSNTKDAIPHVQLKVSDFGVSKAKFTSSRYTTGSVGTTAWMAPEVYEEEGNERYTNKADVYSFGMVCYEILTGKLPFEGMTQVRRRVLSGERPSLTSNCPRALSSYIERCWHADPEERPSFTQICRMLRFFKACILLQDYDDNDDPPEYSEWLLHPLPPRMCGLIDDRLRNLVLQRFDGAIQPQLVVIPLEMYCCRVVLQQFRDEIYVDDQGSHAAAAGIHQVAEHQRSGVELQDLRQPAKRVGYFSKTVKWLKNLPQRRGLTGELADEELSQAQIQLALGSLTGGFTSQELRRATNNFAFRIGSSCGFYYGQLVDGRRIAVRKAVRSNPIDCLDTFLREVKVSNLLRHPNIVPVLGWCQERGSLDLVYEYMPNEDLKKHIFPEDRNYVLGWQQRFKVVHQVARVLSYVHTMRIVHRNIKISHILLDSGWNAHLGDWLLAVLLEEGDSGRKDVKLAGTIGFIAPEYINTDTRASYAGDIFSFGVTVLEIVTGRKVYDFSDDIKDPLIQSVWNLYQKGELMQAADVRLAGNFNEAEMRRLLLLGLACVSELQARPTIDEVLHILSMVSDPPPLHSSNFQWSRTDSGSTSSGAERTSRGSDSDSDLLGR